MRIIWNSAQETFELEFDRSRWHEDLALAKGAKFKTTGPPDWVWFTTKVKCLQYLQEHKPLGGIAITEEALAQFKERSKQEEAKEAVMKIYRDEKAKEKKKKRSARAEQEHEERRENYKLIEHVPYKAPPPPDVLCVSCKDPVYDIFEQVLPYPICLWCEKTVIDVAKNA